MTAGSPTSPTSAGSTGHSGPRARAMPSARSRRSSRIRPASSAGDAPGRRGRRGRRGPTAARRPARPAIATSPRCTMNSSSIATFCCCSTRVDAHGFTHVSGSSRVGSGPDRRAAGRGCRGGTRRWPAPSRVASSCQPRSSPRAGPLGHLGAVQRDVLAGPQHRAQLDQAWSSSASRSSAGRVRRAQPAPHHQIGARRHRAGRIDLQHRQVTQDVHETGRSRGVQQLCPHRDPPSVRAGKPVNGRHVAEPNGPRSGPSAREGSDPALGELDDLTVGHRCAASDRGGEVGRAQSVAECRRRVASMRSASEASNGSA